MNLQAIGKALLSVACTLSALLPTLLFAGSDGAVFQAITTKGTIQTLWYPLHGQKQSIYATNILRSLDYDYQPGDSVIFYGNRYDAEGLPIPEAVASLPHQNTPKRLLLIFNRLETHTPLGLRYSVTVLPDDLDQFPLGSFKFINVSDSKIAVNLDRHKFILNRRDSNTLQMTPPEKGDLSIQIASQGPDGVWQTNYANGWSHRSNRRTLVFVVNKGTDSVRPLRIRETKQMSDG